MTSLVQGWVTTPASNFGLALSSAAGNVLFDAKENDETAHVARLDITITSQGATGATGAQGIQGIQGATGAQGIQGINGATEQLEHRASKELLEQREQPVRRAQRE